MNKSEQLYVDELKERCTRIEKERNILRDKIRDLYGYLNVLEASILTEDEMKIITNIEMFLRGIKNE